MFSFKITSGRIVDVEKPNHNNKTFPLSLLNRGYKGVYKGCSNSLWPDHEGAAFSGRLLQGERARRSENFVLDKCSYIDL